MKNKFLKITILLFLFLTINVAFAQTEKVLLNFDDVEIPVFLKTMSEITGKSFIVSDKVKGRISFVSSEEVPVDKVYDVILSILKARGFLAVPEDNNIIHIYPAQEALKMSGSIYYGTEKLKLKEDVIVTQIIPLINAKKIPA